MKSYTISLILLGAGLAAAAPAMAQPSRTGQSGANAQDSSTSQERRICRRMQETGSLARRRRQCYTQAEWDRIAEAARINGQRLQDDMRGAPTGN
jgi:hypothetical protein